MANYHPDSRASSVTAHDTSSGTQTPINAATYEGDKDNNSVDHFGSQEEEKIGARYGRVIGGRYFTDYHEGSSDDNTHGPLLTIDSHDIPLTLTEKRTIDDVEYIILKFVDGDKENPYNWSSGRKRFISLLLCLMTLFIGLATTAYSSGIDSMVEDLGTTTELGQMGLFCFNMACALAPVCCSEDCYPKLHLTLDSFSSLRSANSWVVGLSMSVHMLSSVCALLASPLARISPQFSS